MSKPQQPEIARSRRAPTDQDSFELKAAESAAPLEDGSFGKVPPANRPGHHPENEQDKPSGPPPADLLLETKNALEGEGGSLVLLNPSQSVLKVLELTRMSAVFESLVTVTPTAGPVPFRPRRQLETSKVGAGVWDLTESGASTFFG